MAEHPPFRVAAFGACYVDINVPNYPFADSGIPAEVELIGDEHEVVSGGSAVNFCRMLGNLGLDTTFVGVAGDENDLMGDVLTTLLSREGVTAALIRQQGALTNLGYNLTNKSGKHIMCISGTANAALSSETVLPKLQEIAAEMQMIYAGGCFKLKAFMQGFEELPRHIGDSTTLTVDHGRVPKDLSPDMARVVRQFVLQADYYLPSRDEFCTFWNTPSIEAGLELLHAAAPELTVVVKDGPNGAYYRDDTGIQHALGLPVEHILNLTGAGDSFNAGFIRGIAAKKSVGEAATYANHVAAAKISGRPIPQLA